MFLGGGVGGVVGLVDDGFVFGVVVVCVCVCFGGGWF